MRTSLNGVKTAFLLGALSALILFVAVTLGGQNGLAIGLVIALATNGFAYFNSDKLALRAMRAYPADDANAPVLMRIVRELSMKANKPMPRVYISPTESPNAFATGRNPKNAAVCATEGIMKLLNERELRGVIGHELAHVYNRDILTASVAATLSSVLMYMVQFFWFFGGNRRGNPIAGMALLIIGPLAASLLQMAIGRSREYAADEDGAVITQDPLSLASALQKIDAGVSRAPLRPTPQTEAASSMMIANPFRGSGMARLFSTHPPTKDRVNRLEAM
ncbi:MAG: zinc metalloprotease HtpX, partial [Candidatus Nanopelagicales bacterium]